MLEKVLFCDAHFHFSDCFSKNLSFVSENYTGCSSCQKKQDLESIPMRYNISFGIHPLEPGKENLFLLENLLQENKIQAIGECGFDFWNEKLKEKKDFQKEVFEAQLEMAKSYNKPLVIHSRKANEILFSYTNEFKKIPSVLFHSFMGTLFEAESFVRRGVHCYFSFGKQIFNNNKKVIEIVRALPVERLLLETDAPYQFLKGEEGTSMQEIQKIYEGAFLLKKENLKQSVDFSGFCEILKQNYMLMYGNRD